MKLSNLINMKILPLYLALQSYGCVMRDRKESDDLCSYEKIEETEEEQNSRIGGINCEEIVPGHNNAFEDRINIVFLGLNTDNDRFTDNIENSVDCSTENQGLLSNEVLADNMSRFNFWYHPDISQMPYADGIFYKDESMEEIINPKLHGAVKARECDGENTILRNVASVVITEDLVRSRAIFPRLSGYNIDRNNFQDLLMVKETLTNHGIDQQFCEDLTSVCYLLDHNNDRIFEESDLETHLPYSPTEIGTICSVFHPEEECHGLSRQEVINEFENSGKEYGFQMCQAFSQSAYNEFRNPDDGMCKILLGEDDYDLGSAIVYDRGTVPQSVCHETGHSIWALRDEYTNDSDAEQHGGESRIIPSVQHNGINCFAGTNQECLSGSNWSHLEGTGCYEGCNYLRSGVFRPMENTYMNNHVLEGGYGPYGEERICKILTLLTGSADGVCENYLNVGND